MPSHRQRINLEAASVLVLEDSPLATDILIQILSGFGVKAFHRCDSVEQAKTAARDHDFHLMMVSTAPRGEEDGYDFVRWLRRSKLHVNSFTPVIMLCAHSRRSMVVKARDCGANFTIAKPLTTAVVLDRIIWVSRERRPFIETDGYLGPDRRFKEDGLPAGVAGRRRGEPSVGLGAQRTVGLPEHVGAPLLQPKRIDL